jgi:hypothetical protein
MDSYCQVTHIPTLYRYRTCNGFAEFQVTPTGVPGNRRSVCGYHLSSILRELQALSGGAETTFTVTRIQPRPVVKPVARRLP